jgi:hypothetical protein
MTSTMRVLRSSSFPRTFFAPLALALAFLAFSSAPARADILGTCDTLSDLITCKATDVGKPCQGGGSCMAVPCAMGQLGQGATMVYKCDTCPTIVAAPSGFCTFTNMGATCGDGDGGSGTCSIISPQCQTATGAAKVSCQIPSTEKPTGPPAGEGGGSSGCDVAPKPPKPTAIGLGLVVVGLLAFGIDRARRRSR